MAKSQGTELHQGDILLIRSGFVKWYNEASSEERRAGTELGSEWAGVEGTRESVEWLWNHHFAAVGGDANVFEAWPAKDERYRALTLPLPFHFFPLLFHLHYHEQTLSATDEIYQ